MVAIRFCCKTQARQLAVLLMCADKQPLALASLFSSYDCNTSAKEGVVPVSVHALGFHECGMIC